MPRRFKVIKH